MPKAPKPTHKQCRAMFDAAHAAGVLAAEEATPTPMLVQQHASPLDDSSPVTKQWEVPEGPCGFAMVLIRPATSRFANWLKKNGHAQYSDYYKAVLFFINGYGQSHTRKKAFAGAFARELQQRLAEYENSENMTIQPRAWLD